MTLIDFKNKLKDVAKSVSHYKAPPGTKAPWITWAEQSRDGFFAGNTRMEYIDNGVVDLFTKDERDPLVKTVEAFFCEDEISFYLEAIQYEEDTGIIHYTWSFSVE